MVRATFVLVVGSALGGALFQGSVAQKCEKDDETGWWSGGWLQAFESSEAPQSSGWTWRQCAQKCATTSACYSWTLQLPGHASEMCILKTSRTTYNNGGYHASGISNSACAGDDITTGGSEVCFANSNAGLWFSASGSGPGVTTTVKSGACSFSGGPPIYMASLRARNGHWTVTGVNAIYWATTNSFDSYLYKNSETTPDFTNNQKDYSLDWIGHAPGIHGASCAGRTPAGTTTWIYYSSQGIYTDVDISHCGFSSTPIIVSNMGGDNNMWRLRGSSSVYSASATSFRVYIFDGDPGYSVTTANAAAKLWHINWIAQMPGTTSTVGSVMTCAASSSDIWTTYGDQVYKDVYFGSYCPDMPSNPVLVTSLHGTNTHWAIRGVNNIYERSGNHFRVYLIADGGLSVQTAANKDFKINYILAAEAPPTPSPTPSPTSSPTASPTASPTTSPTTSPTPSPTSSPTPSPTTSPTMSPTTSPTPSGGPSTSGLSPGGGQISAKGDPHLANIYGQRFDILRPGIYTLVEVPMFGETKLIRVQADVQRVGSGCNEIYVTKLDITGQWPNATKAGGFHFKSGDLGDGNGGEWLHLGKVDVKVVGARTADGTDYLNCFFRNLGKMGLRVGGLLGEGDHTIASTPSKHCQTNIELWEPLAA